MVTQDLKLLLEGDASSFVKALNRAIDHMNILRGAMAKSGDNTDTLKKQTENLGTTFQNLITDAYQVAQGISDVGLKAEFMGNAMAKIGGQTDSLTSSQKKLNTETHTGILLHKKDAQALAEKSRAGGGIKRIITDTMELIRTIDKETAKNIESTQKWGLKFDRIAKLRAVYKELGADTSDLDLIHQLLSKSINLNIDNMDELAHKAIDQSIAVQQAEDGMQAYHDHVSPIAKATRAASEEFLGLTNAVLLNQNSLDPLNAKLAALTMREQEMISMTADSSEQMKMQNAALQSNRAEQDRVRATIERVTDAKEKEAFANTEVGIAADKLRQELIALDTTRAVDVHLGDSQVETLKELKLHFMDLVTNTEYATEADRLHDLGMLKKIGIMQQMDSQLQRSISWDARAAVGTRQAELAQKGYTKQTGRTNAAISNASFAVQDFVTVLQGGGGLERAILSTTNNIGMMASLILPGWQGAVVGVAAAIGSAMVPVLKEWMGFTEEQNEQLKVQVGVLDEWNESAQRRIDLKKAELALEEKNQGKDLGESPLDQLDNQKALAAGSALRKYQVETDLARKKAAEMSRQIMILEDNLAGMPQLQQNWTDAIMRSLPGGLALRRSITKVQQVLRGGETDWDHYHEALRTTENAQGTLNRSFTETLKSLATYFYKYRSTRKKELAEAKEHLRQTETMIEQRSSAEGDMADDTLEILEREKVQRGKALDDKLSGFVLDERETEFHALEKNRIEADAQNESNKDLKGYLDRKERIEKSYQAQRTALQDKHNKEDDDAAKKKKTREDKDLLTLKNNLRKTVAGEREAFIAKTDIWAEEQLALLALAKTRGQVTDEEVANIKKVIAERKKSKVEDFDKTQDKKNAKIESDRAKRKMDVHDEINDILDSEHQRQVRALQDQKDNLAARAREEKIGGDRLIAAMKAIQDKIDALNKKEEDKKKPAGQPDTFEERLDKINAQRAATGQAPIHAGSRQGRAIQRQVNQEQEDFGARQREAGKGMGGRIKAWKGYFDAHPGKNRAGDRWEAIRNQLGMIPGSERAQGVVGAGAIASGARGEKMGTQQGTGLADMIPLLGLNQQTNQMNNQMLQTIIDEIDRLKANALKDQQDQRKIKKSLRASRRAGRN